MFETSAHAHGGHNHATPTPPPAPSAALSRTAERYKTQIEPIFRAKCFDCHTRFTRYPWYHRVPAVHQLLEYDITVAQRHINMSEGFPFASHGSPQEDLEAIIRAVNTDSMPPWRYRLLHWNTSLTDQERALILDWAKEGLSGQ